MSDQAIKLRQLVNRMKINNKGMKTITVTSGKGGVGKSNFTVNFAIGLSKKGYRVLIIDSDFGLSNIDVIMGISPTHNLFHVIKQQKSIVEVITEGPCGVGVISGGSGVYDLIKLDEGQLDAIMMGLLKLEDLADIIIFDTGAGISDNILRLIRSSNETILVTTPEPTAIVDAYALLKTVSKTDSSCRIRVVLNRVDSIKEAESTLDNFVSVAKKYLCINIEELGYMHNDENVSKAVKQQEPFTLKYPSTNVSKDISRIVNKYLELPDLSEEKRGIRKFISRLLEKS